MTATLRFVLDRGLGHAGPAAESDLALAAVELARSLVLTAPSGCEVEAIVPADKSEAGVDAGALVPGLAGVTRLALARRELAAAWQLGMPTGVGGGLIHAPSLTAPLLRHDRVHDHDQTVVTLWDLDAWERPDELPRAHVVAQRAMLKRAVRFADAVVVPTHAAAARLAETAKLGDRLRVVSGAPPEGFRVPGDEVGRRRSLDLPEGFVLLSGSADASAGLVHGFRAVSRAGVDLPVVVIDAPEGSEPALAELAAAAGIAESRVHVRPALEVHDRGAVFGGAVAYVAPATVSAFPWRLVEALRLGVPVVAAASAVHREVLAEGGLVAAAEGEALGDALSEALASALGSTAAAERLGVLAGDRGRAFSWAGAAERVWQLHADL
jgi:glycosyltransferase involved in cell wall biosynthesis